MSPRRPAARASAARDNVAYCERFRPGSLAAIRATIPDAVLDKIDKATGASWLDYEYDHFLMDGTIAVLGVDDSIACWRESMQNLVEMPLLKSFVDGAIRLFARKPGGLLKMLPKGWTLAYRDFCLPVFERTGENSARISLEDIAPEAFASPGYLHCWHAVCLGVFDLERVKDGEVSFEIDEARAQAVASFAWK